MPAGNAGLEYLISKGSLRRVSKDDLNGWIGQGARLQMVGGPFMGMDTGHDPLSGIGGTTSAYLVLKALDVVPADLAGADAVIFVIPSGVPVPGMARVEHNSFYRLEGYPGIPPAGAPVPLDSRARMIAGVERMNAAQSGASQAPAAGAFSDPLILSAPEKAGPSPWWGLLILPMGAALAWVTISRRGAGSSRAGTPGTTPVAGAEPPEPEASKRRPAQATTEAVSPPAETTARTILDRLIHVSETVASEDTAFAATRLRRAILTALDLPEYDDDIGSRMDDIVERRLPQALTPDVEAPVLDGLRSELEALMDQQAQRDAGALERTA